MGILRIRKTPEDQSPEEGSDCIQVSDTVSEDDLAVELKVDLRNPVTQQNEPDNLVKIERQGTKCKELDNKWSSKGIVSSNKVKSVQICFTTLVLFQILAVTGDIGEQDRPCSWNQYWDYERLTCLDICGDRGELKCRVEFFCSATKPELQIEPPQCMPWCSQECAYDLYCDSETRKCFPCSNICNSSADDLSLCRIHCLAIYNSIQRSTTTPDFMTQKGPTDEQSSPPLTASEMPSNSPGFKYATYILAAIAAVAVVFTAVLIYLLRRRKKCASHQVNMEGSHMLVSYAARTEGHNNNETHIHQQVTQL